jgi:hypothetical protein
MISGTVVGAGATKMVEKTVNIATKTQQRKRTYKAAALRVAIPKTL